MCGIAGVIGERNPLLAKKLLSKINHRGPDDSGYWTSSEDELPVLLCHSRLSILDLSSAGSQPFESADGRFVIVYNGEIYNFLELRSDLADKYGISF